MALEKVGIDLQAVGAAQFTRDVNASEFALRQQAKAFDDSARALQAEIVALRNSTDPNRELIKSKQALLNQTRENSAETKASIAALREQGQAYKDTTVAVNEHKGALATAGSVIGSTISGTIKLIAVVTTLVSGYELLKKISTSNQEVGKVFDTITVGAQKANKFLGSVIAGASEFIGSLKGMASPAMLAAGALGGLALGAIAIGAAMAIATVGITAIIGAFEAVANIIPTAISAGREFEKAMRSVSTIMTGTQDDVKKLGDQILTLSTKLNVPAVQLAAAQYQILSAGITDAATAFETLDQSGQLATAGLGTLTESANILTSAINDFGLAPKEAADVLFTTIQDGKTTTAELAQGFGLVAGTAQSAGVSFKELSAATAALTSTGLHASEAQTSLRAAITNITNPSDEAQKVATKLGLAFNGAALQSKGLTGFLVDLKAKVGDNKTALGQLFGSVEAYNSVVQLLGSQQKQYIKILGDLDHANGSLAVGFAKQRDSVSAISNAINNELIKAGRNILSQFNPVLEQLSALFFKAGSAGKVFIDSIQDVVNEIARLAADFLKLGLSLLGLSDALDTGATGLKAIAQLLDAVSTAGEVTAHVLASVASAAAKFAFGDLVGTFNALKDLPAYLQSKSSAFAARQAGRFGPPAKDVPIAPGKPPAPKPNTDPNANKEINVKNQQSESKADRQRVENVQRDYEHQIAQMRDSSELAIKQQGPFANQDDTLKAKLIEEQNAAALLGSELVKLQNTTVKTADGKRALAQAIAKTKDDLAKEKVAIQDASNAWEKYIVQQKENDFKRNADLQVASIQFITDQAIKGEDEQAQVEATAYANRKTTIDDYYSEVQQHIKNKADAEQAAYDKTNTLIDQEIELLKSLEGIDETNPKIKDLRASQQKLYVQNEGTQAGYSLQSDQAKQQQKQDLTQASRDFGQALEGDISQALQDAFSGTGPLAVIKSFAKSLYTTVVQSLSQAVAAGFAKSQIFQQITTTVGNLINKLSGKSGVVGTATGGSSQSLAPLFSGVTRKFTDQGEEIQGPFQEDATGTINSSPVASKLSGIAGNLGKAAGAIGGLVASFQGGKAAGSFLGPKTGAIGGSLAGGLAGGLAGTLILPGIGTLIGGAIGGVVGAIGGIFGAGSSSKAAKAAKRAEYHQNVLAPYLTNVVNTANPDNLDDLNASFLKAARGMKSNGSDGEKLKKQAMAQIQQLIDAREAAIDTFVKDTKQQNDDLADTIALADAKPIDQAAMQRDIDLKKIQTDTDALLAQYKDSQEAQTEILQQESLKRQQLLQTEQDDFKSKTQDLAALLQQRDDIANANVFTRLRSPEQVKADQLTTLDGQIAQAALELKGAQAAGEGADSLGSNQILQGLSQINNNNLQITINESNDPNKTTEAITRALAALNLKVYGATA